MGNGKETNTIQETIYKRGDLHLIERGENSEWDEIVNEMK